MDELLLVRVLTRLVQVRLELGDKCYEDAAAGALVAIGRSAMRAAEMEAGLAEVHDDNVIPFQSHGWQARSGDDCT
ncbi:hypothetical protein [Devosia naphthalenivorans]|uniref:hypothetical protein n=1 Tax=Devosia naphthalenivorans TaxID=2082392 RepID=UPI000D3C0681|nr:hypothetical protein [Devosia naphthalenivorans]